MQKVQRLFERNQVRFFIALVNPYLNSQRLFALWQVIHLAHVTQGLFWLFLKPIAVFSSMVESSFFTCCPKALTKQYTVTCRPSRPTRPAQLMKAVQAEFSQDFQLPLKTGIGTVHPNSSITVAWPLKAETCTPALNFCHDVGFFLVTWVRPCTNQWLNCHTVSSYR